MSWLCSTSYKVSFDAVKTNVCEPRFSSTSLPKISDNYFVGKSFLLKKISFPLLFFVCDCVCVNAIALFILLYQNTKMSAARWDRMSHAKDRDGVVFHWMRGKCRYSIQYSFSFFMSQSRRYNFCLQLERVSVLAVI